MKKTIVGIWMIFFANIQFAQASYIVNCTFGLDGIAYFKTSFILKGPNSVGDNLTVLSMANQPVTTLSIKSVAAQNTQNSQGRKEIARVQITPSSELPDVQALVMYQQLAGDRGHTPAALLLNSNALGSSLNGSCTSDTASTGN